ncbi:MAG: ABC transporter permease [Elusimicrobiota bacterium]|jgi:simple sugar transport system permease protein|nr:ABC transporter permease [Elusimicrobiota bacterium]
MIDKIIEILKKPISAIIIALIVGFLVGFFVLLIAGYNPFEAYGAMIGGMFDRPKYISQIIINAVPIIMTGLSVAFAYRSGLFNIGAEGQYIIGTITAAMLGYYLHLPIIIHPIVILIAACFFGGVFGAIAGWLKVKYGTNEVVSTIMLNWIALYLNNTILSIPGVQKGGTQASYDILPSASMRLFSQWKTTPEGLSFINSHPILGDFLRTDIHIGIILTLIFVFATWFFLMRTTKGFELRSVGANPSAAEFAGISIKKNTVFAMFIAGALAALGGAFQVLGTSNSRIVVLSITEGFGWDGLSVALLANNNPLATLLSGWLFSGLKFGGGSIQSSMGAPSEIINIMIGAIVFCVALVAMFPMIATKLSAMKMKKEWQAKQDDKLASKGAAK